MITTFSFYLSKKCYPQHRKNIAIVMIKYPGTTTAKMLKSAEKRVFATTKLQYMAHLLIYHEQILRLLCTFKNK